MTDEDKTLQEIMEELSAPTPDHEVHFFPQKVITHTSPPKALCVPYTKRQFTEDRLDAAVGAFGWQSDARSEQGALIYGIGILNPESNEWIWKWDTGSGDGSDAANEIVTGGIKRVGRLWGIARDISRLEAKWRNCQTKVRSNGKEVFDGWDDPPTVDELRQFTQWVRNRGPSPEDESGGDGGGSGNGASGSPSTGPAGGRGRVADDPATQFWHLSRQLKAKGKITDERVSAIVKRHTDDAGHTDFEAARADLDTEVPF